MSNLPPLNTPTTTAYIRQEVERLEEQLNNQERRLGPPNLESPNCDASALESAVDALTPYKTPNSMIEPAAENYVDEVSEKCRITDQKELYSIYNLILDGLKTNEGVKGLLNNHKTQLLDPNFITALANAKNNESFNDIAQCFNDIARSSSTTSTTTMTTQYDPETNTTTVHANNTTTGTNVTAELKQDGSGSVMTKNTTSTQAIPPGSGQNTTTTTTSTWNATGNTTTTTTQKSTKVSTTNTTWTTDGSNTTAEIKNADGSASTEQESAPTPPPSHSTSSQFLARLTASPPASAPRSADTDEGEDSWRIPFTIAGVIIAIVVVVVVVVVGGGGGGGVGVVRYNALNRQANSSEEAANSSEAAAAAAAQLPFSLPQRSAAPAEPSEEAAAAAAEPPKEALRLAGLAAAQSHIANLNLINSEDRNVEDIIDQRGEIAPASCWTCCSQKNTVETKTP